MTNTPATTGNNLPSAQVNKPSEVLRSDIIVPYMVIAQAMSESVTDRKASIGDIVRSTSLEKLGDPDKPVEVVFLSAPATKWVYEKRTGDKFKFHHIENRNASNETLPWYFFADEEGNEMTEGQRGAIEWRRVKQLLVLAVLPQDIAAAEAEMKKMDAGELPDPSKALTPIAISFRSTSYKAGKEVTTFFSQAKSMNVPIWRYSLTMCCKQEKNDEGTFYVWTVDRTKAKAVPKEQVAQVQVWADMLAQNANDIQLDDSVEEGDMPQASSTETARTVC